MRQTRPARPSARLAAACLIAALAVPGLSAGPAQAAEFRVITDRDSFLTAVGGRELSYRGFRLRVSPQGGITGRGLGREVTGEWQWQGRYFCRTLRWGRTDVGANCQTVAANDSAIRFQADEGQGDVAIFRMR